MSSLVIKNLHAKVEDREILKGVDLTIHQGEVHALMGPNGSGKSTLSYAVGPPELRGHRGRVLYKGQNLLELEPDERAKAASSSPSSTPTVDPRRHVANFLRHGGTTSRKRADARRAKT